MRKFTLHFKTPQGTIIDYTTEVKKASEFIAKYEVLIGWFAKQGWHEVVLPTTQAPTPAPQATTVAQNTGFVDLTVDHLCKRCGASMEYKNGVSKAGKQYKGFFCPNNTKEDPHMPEWVK